MTDRQESTWEDSLNRPLVQRLKSPLTEAGIIRNRMAKRIIDRLPDRFDRLPLLAQQMQRWSQVVDLQSERIPIVYVEPQTTTPNPSVASSDANPGQRQLPVVKAKPISVSGVLPQQGADAALVYDRSQSTDPAVTPPLTSPNPISSPAETPATPIVRDRTSPSQPLDGGSTPQIQRKLDPQVTATASTPLELPVVSANTASSQPKPDAEASAIHPQQPPPILLPEQSLVKLSQSPTSPIESSSNPITAIVPSTTPPIQRKLDPQTRTGESPALDLPVVSANAAPSQPKPDAETIVIHPQQPSPIPLSQQPLVNPSQGLSSPIETASNPITPVNPSATPSIQRKLDPQAAIGESSSLELPVVSVSGLRSEVDTTQIHSQPPSPVAISQQPLIPVSQRIVANSSNPATALNPGSPHPIQPPLDPRSEPTPLDLPVLLTQVSPASSDPQLPIAIHPQQPPPQSAIAQPLAKTSQTIAPSPNPVSTSITPISQKLDPQGITRETRLDLPVVSVKASPLSSDSRPESDRTQIDLQPQPAISESTPITFTRPVATPQIQRKFDPSSVVYPQPLTPEVAGSESRPLVEKVARDTSSLESQTVDRFTPSPLVKPQTPSNPLPIVTVDYETPESEYEALVFSVSPPLQQHPNSFYDSSLNPQTPWVATAGNRETSSQPPASIQNIASHPIPLTPPSQLGQSQLNSPNPTLAGVNLPPQIDVDDLVDKVERKLLRRLVVESERRGKRKWP